MYFSVGGYSQNDNDVTNPNDEIMDFLESLPGYDTLEIPEQKTDPEIQEPEQTADLQPADDDPAADQQKGEGDKMAFLDNDGFEYYDKKISRDLQSIDYLEDRVKKIDGAKRVDLERGNISMSATSLTYTNSTTRLRTPQGQGVPVSAGDIIHLCTYTGATFYVSIETGESQYTVAGWLTKDYVVNANGTAHLLARFAPEATINVGDLYFEIVDSQTRMDTLENINNGLKKNGLIYRTLDGGTLESWSETNIEPDSGRMYKLTIHPFTKRSTLTSGYLCVEVWNYYTEETSARIYVVTIGNYTGQEINIDIDNSDSTIDHVNVKVRAENGTKVYMSFVDKTEINDISADLDTVKSAVNIITPYFEQEAYTADYTDATIDSTYVGRTFYPHIESGDTVDFEIVAPEGDTNQVYFNIYTGSTRVQSTFFTGTGSRKTTLTNSFGETIDRIDAVVARVYQKNVYSVEITYGRFIPDELDEMKRSVAGVTYPSYYDSMLNTAIPSAFESILNAGKNGESFVFISDVHWAGNTKHSPELIGYITKNLPVQNVIYGGDTINGGQYGTQVELMRDFATKMNRNSPRFFALLGNHDTNALDGGTAFTHNEFYSIVQKYADYNVNFGGSNYYSFDNKATKTRYIMLDSGMGEGNDVQNQTVWLTTLLSELDSDWHVIVFVHVMYQTHATMLAETPTTFMQGINALLDANNENANNAKVEAIFSGHTHDDFDSATEGGIPIVVIDCDIGTQTESGNTRTAGTVNEQAFDIVTVNYSDSVINCTRIGSGEDREISY